MIGRTHTSCLRNWGAPPASSVRPRTAPPLTLSLRGSPSSAALVVSTGLEQVERVWVRGRLPGEGWGGGRGACQRAHARSACGGPLKLELVGHILRVCGTGEPLRLRVYDSAPHHP